MHYAYPIILTWFTPSLDIEALYIIGYNSHSCIVHSNIKDCVNCSFWSESKDCVYVFADYNNTLLDILFLVS